MRFTAAVFISMLLTASSAWAERPQRRDSSDFFVQLNARKQVFYADEYIDFKVMKRSDVKLSPNCKLDWSGTVQVLRNGNVIKSFTSGPVSRMGIGTVRGVQYVYYGWGFGPYQFLDSERPVEIGADETFQFRAICGDDVSEPSKPFRISEWRKPVDGIQVFVTPFKKSYKVGEAIRVKVTMRNIGATSKRVPVPFPEDGYLRSFWALKPHWLDERPFVGDKLFYARSLKILKPGESRTAVFDLKGYRGKGEKRTQTLGGERGRYLVWFSVFNDDDNVPAKYRKNLWWNDLTSNMFEIVIE